MNDHLPAYCCRHVFTAACPIDCLRVVLSTAAFHVLARAEGAPFPPPVTVEEVLGLRRAGQLSLVAGLGPRRLGEIEAGLVLAGFALGDATPPARDLPPAPSSGSGRSSDKEEPSC